MGFPDGTSGKELTCQGRRHKRCRFNPWVAKMPWKRAWQPTPVFLPGEPHGQRSLAGYSPQGRKESDTTEVTECTQPSIYESSMCIEVKLFYYFKIFTVSYEESLKVSTAFLLTFSFHFRKKYFIKC